MKALRMGFEATSQSIYYWNFCEDARVQSRSLLQESILGDGAFEPRRPVAFTGQILHNSLFLGKLKTLLAEKVWSDTCSHSLKILLS